jgi:hypothetical protein
MINNLNNKFKKLTYYSFNVIMDILKEKSRRNVGVKVQIPLQTWESLSRIAEKGGLSVEKLTVEVLKERTRGISSFKITENQIPL